jgi:hypothetical protein
MATTADGIIYPVAGDYIAPLNAHIQALAESTQAAINARVPLSSISYTPTFSGLTIGNGSVIARYSRVGGIVVDEITITFGTTTTVTGSISINNLPVGSFSSFYAAGNMPCGKAFFRDASGGSAEGTVRISSLRGLLLQASVASSTYVTSSSLSSSVPFSWSVNDQIFISTVRLAA